MLEGDQVVRDRRAHRRHADRRRPNLAGSLWRKPVRSAGDDVARRPLATMDTTRKQAEITLDSLRLPGDAMLGAEGDGWPVLARVLDLASVALAAEAVEER